MSTSAQRIEVFQDTQDWINKDPDMRPYYQPYYQHAIICGLVIKKEEKEND